MKNKFSLILGTNVWTHLMTPLAQELVALLGADRFRLAVFEALPDERRTLGWQEPPGLPWVIGPPSTEREKERLYRFCADADVMIYGSCPEAILRTRAASGKLTFVQSERMLKKPFHYLRMVNPRYAHGIMSFRALVNRPHIHSLAIGHEAPHDLQMMRAFGDRIWKWGYFTEVNPERPLPVDDRPIRIMWAGRMLSWKRVDLLLRAVEAVQDEPWFGTCTIIGDGEERDKLLMLARRLHIRPEKAAIVHAVPFSEVRIRMRQNDLYVLPSNRHEGWGAVAGEAMSEGCVLVANEAAGSARELVKHGETGFLFGDGDAEHLASVIERAARDYTLRMSVRERAWEQMHALWTPRIAAERLLALISGLLGLSSEMPRYDSGPCSRAVAASGPTEETASARKVGAIGQEREEGQSVPIFRMTSNQKWQ